MTRKSRLKEPFNNESFFGKIAREQVIAKPSKSGSSVLQVKPQRSRDFDWHRPLLHVPEFQWRPETGMSRYNFEREHTPPHQKEFFMELQFMYQVQGPPSLAPDDLWIPVRESRLKGEVLDNGLPGSDLGKEFWEAVGRYVITRYSPDGQWRFTFQAVKAGDGLADRLDVRHRDYRTLPDYNLLVRFRSWVLPDTRSAYMIFPGTDVTRPGWEADYENDTPNNLQLISTRPPTEEGA